MSIGVPVDMAQEWNREPRAIARVSGWWQSMSRADGRTPETRERRFSAQRNHEPSTSRSASSPRPLCHLLVCLVLSANTLSHAIK